MKELITYLIKSLTQSDNFKIEESEEDGKVSYTIKADPEIIGIIIGKGGSTIRAIRHIVRIKATLDNKSVFVNVSEA